MNLSRQPKEGFIELPHDRQDPLLGTLENGKQADDLVIDLPNQQKEMLQGFICLFKTK